MRYARTITICSFWLVCSIPAAEGQGLSQYRSFELGSDLASVSRLAGVAPSQATTVHQRPALLQDLEWRPSRWISGTGPSTDPVDQVVFSFYNDQLFRMTVGYAPQRTEGMTKADLIQGISAVYGTAMAPPRTPPRVDAEFGTVAARWGNEEHAVVLYESSSYGPTFRLVVTDALLDGLATKAKTQAVRLDYQEAPAREIERQKKERVDEDAAAAKVRAANKGTFRP